MSSSVLRRFRAYVLLILLGSVGGLIGCGGGNAASDVEVIEPRLVQTPSGQRAFTGTLVNQGARPISIAQIEVALYDDTGSEVETIRFEVEDIPAGDSSAFSNRIDSDRPFSQAQVQNVMTP